MQSSGRREGSVTRKLSGELIASLGDVQVTERDLSGGLPFVDEAWIGANFTPTEERTAAHRHALARSDELVDELEAADVVVIGAPVYNFAIPAVLKAWIDMVARARRTFAYTADGPIGLLQGKRAIIVVASGGTELGSEIDFATGYLRHVFGFIGITDVTFVSAERQVAGADTSLGRARAQIEAIRAAA